jgi:hypothetical protein
MKIHPVFYISLLEPADPGAPLDLETELNDERSEREYDVETILDYTITGR